MARPGGRGVVLTVKGEAVASSCSGVRGHLDQGKERQNLNSWGCGSDKQVPKEAVLEEEILSKEVKVSDVKTVIKKAEVEVRDLTKEEARRLVGRGRGKQVRAKLGVSSKCS